MSCCVSRLLLLLGWRVRLQLHAGLRVVVLQHASLRMLPLLRALMSLLLLLLRHLVEAVKQIPAGRHTAAGMQLSSCACTSVQHTTNSSSPV